VNGIRIGSILGFDVEIHPSWFVVLVLFTVTLADGFFPRAYPDWQPLTTWAVAATAALLLFASVLVHELGHSLVARRQGIPVRNITLFFLGGVASIGREAASPGREATLAGVGPLVSAGIGVATLAAGTAGALPDTVAAVLTYLGVANLSLAVFNLLPGFPLDGGRVLRAALWWRSGDFVRATRQATVVGQVLGGALVVLGLAQLLTGAGFGGVWAAFIGWVLVQAARAAARQVALEEALAGLPTSRIMTVPAGWLAPFVTLEAAAEGHFVDFDDRCLAVEGELPGQAYDGLLCAEDLAREPRERWASERVRDAMVPASRLPTVTPDTPAAEAVRRLRESPADRLAVVDDEGRLVGFVDEAAVARFALIDQAARRGRRHPGLDAGRPGDGG
jgi:Zn-dependent protease